MDDLASQESPKHINLTDKDARLMKTRQGIVPSYNGQAMVSPVTEEGEVMGMLITAVGLVDEPTDYGQFTPMLEQAEEATGIKATMTLADAGYYSGNNLEECAGRGQAVTMPESLPSAERPYHKDRFIYDEQSDSFTCPEGQILHFERIQQSAKNDGVRNRVYRASRNVCRSCPAFGVCTKSKRGRAIAIGKHDATLRGHRAWMSSDTAKEAYKLRKQLVEPVFGILKEQQRARRFLLHGLANVASEWTVLATPSTSAPSGKRGAPDALPSREWVSNLNQHPELPQGNPGLLHPPLFRRSDAAEPDQVAEFFPHTLIVPPFKFVSETGSTPPVLRGRGRKTESL